ncbi:hypothetical protein AB0F81_44110 [Actinoplanes sp. NPDC024001]|uniref:hypothetical protein n=1 Tax=Actinoplanes sp. NPDC024001 TaxID=3154598 RepID=UPI0033C27D4F
MRSRRISSRQVVLTATFLSLAAGGTAACDSSPTLDEWESGPVYESAVDEGGVDESTVDEPAEEVIAAEEEPVDGDEVFYCADEEGEVVDEEYCAEDDGGGLYFLWHSPTYPRGLSTGAYLDGGDYFPPGDRAARKAFRLPATGAVSNGTVKTNVVGNSSGGSSGSSGG